MRFHRAEPDGVHRRDSVIRQSNMSGQKPVCRFSIPSTDLAGGCVRTRECDQSDRASTSSDQAGGPGWRQNTRQEIFEEKVCGVAIGLPEVLQPTVPSGLVKEVPAKQNTVTGPPIDAGTAQLTPGSISCHVPEQPAKHDPSGLCTGVLPFVTMSQQAATAGVAATPMQAITAMRRRVGCVRFMLRTSRESNE